MRPAHKVGLWVACAALGGGAVGQPSWAQAPASPLPTPTLRAEELHLLPLPGGLDAQPMLVSNSPEVLLEPGMTVHTGAPARGRGGAPYLHQAPLEGALRVFIHHIVKGQAGVDAGWHLALIALNPGRQAARLRVEGGASYLSQPEAPFVALPPWQSDPWGQVYAGPGDRLGVSALMGRSPIPPRTLELPPGAPALVWQGPVPTEVPIPPPVNGRSTLLALRSEGALHYAVVATRAPAGPQGGHRPPTLADHLAHLERGRLAGPREPDPPAYAPTGPLPKPFRYGRVAGLAQGATWQGEVRLAPPPPGLRVGWPVATARANPLGTGQVQSGAMRARVEGTAWGNHGNYGVAYRMRFTFPKGGQARRVAWALGHPKGIVGQGHLRQAQYAEPPGPGTTWRGAILVEEGDEARCWHRRLEHLVLKAGQAPVRFHRTELPAGEARVVQLRWVYPPDATPPQLLQLEGLP